MKPVALKFTAREGICPFLEKHFSTVQRVRDALRCDFLLSCTFQLRFLDGECRLIIEQRKKTPLSPPLPCRYPYLYPLRIQ
jgi:hypothetical protein